MKYVSININQYFSTDTKEMYSEKIAIADKNFDNQFLLNVPNFFKNMKFQHRFLDPGSMYFKPKIDNKPSSLKTRLERAGIKKPSHMTIVAL